MEINAYKYQVIGNTVDDTAFTGVTVSQPRELTIRVIQRVAANMEHHADDVETQIAVVVKVSCDDATETGQQRHSRRRHLEFREELGQPKSYRPVKIHIENSFHRTRLVSGFDGRMERVLALQHEA